MGKCRYDLSEDCHGKDCLACTLDKIRAEIKALSNANPSYWHSGDMVEREEVFEIIDKYRGNVDEI